MIAGKIMERIIRPLVRYARVMAPAAALALAPGCAKPAPFPANYVVAPDYAVLSIIEGEMGKTRCANKQPYPLTAAELGPRLVRYALEHDKDFKPLYDKLPASGQDKLVADLAAEMARDTKDRAPNSLLFPPQVDDYKAYCLSYQDSSRLQVSLFPSVAVAPRATFSAFLTRATSLIAVDILGIAPGTKPLALRPGQSTTFTVALDTHLPTDPDCYKAEEANGVSFTVNKKATNFQPKDKDGYFNTDPAVLNRRRTLFTLNGTTLPNAPAGSRELHLIYTCQPDKKETEVVGNPNGWLTVAAPTVSAPAPKAPVKVTTPAPARPAPAEPAEAPATGDITF